jgi:hypothetical protein
MHLLLPDLARDRAAALAQERRRYRSSPPSRARHHPFRRAAAVGLARVSLASAAAVRRLDACLADDLIRPLTTQPDGAGSHGT